MGSEHITVGQRSRQYLEQHVDLFDFAATLTFRTPIYDRITAQSIARRFTNRYNSAMGFNNFRKRKDPRKRAVMIAMLEGDGIHTHLHYHMALKKPEGMTNAEFHFLVQQCWIKTNSGGDKHNKIKPIDDDGWVKYITKEIGKFNVDKIDWENTHFYKAEQAQVSRN